MYGYIKGQVTKTAAEYVIIENNGIGYQLISPNPFGYQLGSEVTCYTYLHVREDIFALYGFKDEETLKLFKKLIGVSGIGPKSGLSIVASGKTDEVLVAIEAGDVKFLTKFPGIGNKSAQQIILDLKGKLVDAEVVGQVSVKQQDITQALLALGYNKTEISKTLKHINMDQPVEKAVKEALAWLLK